MLADEPDLEGAGFFEQVGGDGGFSAEALFGGEDDGVAAVAVGFVVEIDGGDLDVFGGEVDGPVLVYGGGAGGEAEVEVGDGELAGGTGGAVGPDHVCGVVSAGGEGALHEAGTADGDLFHGFSSATDDEGLEAEGIAVHDVNFYGLAFLVGHPVAEVEQEGAVDLRWGGV